VDFAHLVQEFTDFLLMLVYFLPFGNRVFFIKQAAVENKVFVVFNEKLLQR